MAGFARTPFHFAKKGRLVDIRPDDLAAAALRGLIDRLGLDPSLIEEVVMGCAYPEGEQGSNIARIAALLAGLPESVGAVTINRFCGSSMTGIHYAAGQIALGAGEAYLCGGVESMSRVPSNHTPNPKRPEVYVSMGQTAENVAAKYGISRERQEQFALESQLKAARGRAQDLIRVGEVDSDGCLRPATSLEGLAQLKPAFGGTVTAGTASPLTDGAAVVLVCSAEFARRHQLTVMARIRGVAVAGCAPELMGMGPVPATLKVLRGRSVRELDVVELNEAFASQALACIDELQFRPETVNLEGGAIALGHPLGATGARITGQAAQLLHSRGQQWALATQCVGGGQGVATLLEAPWPREEPGRRSRPGAQACPPASIRANPWRPV